MTVEREIDNHGIKKTRPKNEDILECEDDIKNDDNMNSMPILLLVNISFWSNHMQHYYVASSNLPLSSDFFQNSANSKKI